MSMHARECMCACVCNVTISLGHDALQGGPESKQISELLLVPAPWGPEALRPGRHPKMWESARFYN